MEITVKLDDWITGRQMHDLKQNTGIENVTVEDIRRFNKTNDSDRRFYHSLYDLEHKKSIRNLRFNKYGYDGGALQQ